MLEERDSRSLPESLRAEFSGFLATRIGLHFPPERWDDLERAVGAAAREFRADSAETCVRWLMSSDLTRPQIETLASHLTVGETYFFRERRSFDCLERHVLPELIRSRASRERRLRIWSAGCCTGEEPYSIAMLLARTMPDLSEWNISILATDINPRFLQKAALGLYSEWSFRDAPQGIKEEFFRRTREGRFEIVPRIKAMVTFAYLNLAEDAYPSVQSGTNAMDVIFCRNVLMYFEPAHGRSVLERLGRSLLEDGWLFVNPIEISQVALPQLVTVNFPSAIVYRRGNCPAMTERTLAVTPAWLPPATHAPAPPVTFPDELQPEAPPQAKNRREPEAAPERQAPYQQASELYKEGRYTEAAGKLLESLSQNSGDAGAMALLARVYANEGRLDEALEWCGKAVDAEKLNPGWHYLLATILGEQGLIEEAVAALKRALYLDPNHALAHFALGNLIRRQGRLKDSDRYLWNALSILNGYQREQILPESEGITAGRLAEMIRLTVASEAPHES
jgi:chemotaxis protein methyltransferase CheR